MPNPQDIYMEILYHEEHKWLKIKSTNYIIIGSSENSMKNSSI